MIFCDRLMDAARAYAELGGNGAVNSKTAERLAACYARVTAIAVSVLSPAHLAAHAVECLAYADSCVDRAKTAYAGSL
jgi:hypothetical protein